MQFVVSPLRTAGLLILMVGATFFSYMVGTQGSGYESWLGWFGVVIFGFGTLVRAKQLFNKGVVVSIDSQGILATQVARERILTDALGFKKVPKQDLSGVDSSQSRHITGSVL